MSKIAKCPCCGGPVQQDDDPYASSFIACNSENDECIFVCDIKNFTLIAAAMEYAKKTAYWFGLPGGVDHQEDARAEQAMRDAETRVLEVFK